MSHQIVPASPIHDDEFYDALPAFPSSSGHEAEAEADDGGIPFTISLPYHTHVPGPFESERLPTRPASGIQKFLRVANLIESQEPRTAYLCRCHAFQEAYYMYRKSSRKGVRRFMNALLQRLYRDHKATLGGVKVLDDVRELRCVFRAFHEYIISNGKALYLEHSEREKLTNARRIASVLYEVLIKMT